MAKGIYQKVYEFIMKLPLKTKLLLVYFVLIVLPLGIFSMISFSRNTAVTKQQTLTLASQSFEESYSILERQFTSMSVVLKNIINNRFIFDFASIPPEDIDAFYAIESVDYINGLFSYLITSAGIDNIHMYTANGELFDSLGSNISPIAGLENKDWFKNFSTSNTDTFWCWPGKYDIDDNDQYYSLFRFIYDIETAKRRIALLRVDLNKSRIENTLERTIITPNTTILLTDLKSVIAGVSKTPRIYDQLIEWVQNSPSGQWADIEKNSEKAIIRYQKLKNPELYLVIHIPISDLTRVSAELRNEMVIYLLIVATVSFLTALFISQSSIRRLSVLTREMRKVQKGNFNISLGPTGMDEIGELMENFSTMVSKLSELVQEKYNMGIEIKAAELDALQAQINPHFLYNSLDLVNCIAIQNNIPEIVNIISHLARFYKLSLSHGRNIVTVEDELMHVKMYVYIQNMRFDNKIRFEIDADPQVLHCSMLKILLQPIVENAIIHGILEKDNKAGTIRLKAAIQGDDIIFTISDDGVGMTGEKLSSLMNSARNNRRSYGLKNIQERIKLFYGESYGLSFKSKPGVGTTVEVRISAKVPPTA